MGKVTKQIQKKTQNGSIDASKLPVGGKMPLAEGERQALRKLDETAGQLKVALANIELQIASLNKTKAEVIDSLEKQSALMREQAEAVLRSHGGDPTDKDRSWSVNLGEMAIIRVA
jgi:hypothetical protein